MSLQIELKEINISAFKFNQDSSGPKITMPPVVDESLKPLSDIYVPKGVDKIHAIVITLSKEINYKRKNLKGNKLKVLEDTIVEIAEGLFLSNLITESKENGKGLTYADIEESYYIKQSRITRLINIAQSEKLTALALDKGKTVARAFITKIPNLTDERKDFIIDLALAQKTLTDKEATKYMSVVKVYLSYDDIDITEEQLITLLEIIREHKSITVNQIVTSLKTNLVFAPVLIPDSQMYKAHAYEAARSEVTGTKFNQERLNTTAIILGVVKYDPGVEMIETSPILLFLREKNIVSYGQAKLIANSLKKLDLADKEEQIKFLSELELKSIKRKELKKLLAVISGFYKTIQKAKEKRQQENQTILTVNQLKQVQDLLNKYNSKTIVFALISQFNLTKAGVLTSVARRLKSKNKVHLKRAK